MYAGLFYIPERAELIIFITDTFIFMDDSFAHSQSNAKH
jgi:hypothetical protein